jgi:hypothetical protein
MEKEVTKEIQKTKKKGGEDMRVKRVTDSLTTIKKTTQK